MIVCKRGGFCNMKNTVIVTIFFILFSFVLPTAGNTENYTEKELSDHKMIAVLWSNISAEYRALCYQAYNMATIQLEQAVSKHKRKDKPLAVVVDCDDTVLFDGPFQAYLIEHGKSFNSTDWEKWVNEAKAVPVPGALEFLQFAEKNKCEVFYVPNRKNKTELKGTMENLKRAGFPNVDETHVLLKTDSSDKQLRFNEIKKTHNVVLYIGDNINDLPIGTRNHKNEERVSITDSQKNHFGINYIVLPNPMYGGWEDVFAPNYFKLTPYQKKILHRSLLNSWTPEN